MFIFQKKKLYASKRADFDKSLDAGEVVMERRRSFILSKSIWVLIQALQLRVLSWRAAIFPSIHHWQSFLSKNVKEFRYHVQLKSSKFLRVSGILAKNFTIN